MDRFGDYREIISLPNPPIEDFAAGDVGLDLARIGNDAMAELCARHPAAFSDLRRGGVDDRRRGLGQGGAARGQGARRRRHPDLHQYRRAAARRSGVRADVRHHGGARPADLAASGAHRRHAGLCGRAEIALRDVVVLRLALRDLGCDGANGVLRAARSLSGAQDRHPPSRRDDPVLRRPHRSRNAGAGQPHLRRGLFEGPVVAQAAAPGLSARLLRRHRAVRRRHPCGALRARILRQRSRGVRDRHAARPDRADDRSDQAARHRGGRPPQDLRRQCREAAETKLA